MKIRHKIIKPYHWLTVISLLCVIMKAYASHLPANHGGYVLEAHTTNNATINDATTYYFGSGYALVLQTTEGYTRSYIPKAGTIRAAFVTIRVNAATFGTSEISTISIRTNAMSDTTISAAVTCDAEIQVFSNDALSIAVAQGEFFEIKWVTPTWATNPTALQLAAFVYID